jgi:predicted dehydrogenase
VSPIRIGIVGLGKIARDQHVPAIEANPRFALAATVNRAAPASAINFTSYGEMLAAADGLDAVAITTPPGPRYAIARDCIEAGLHVLLEKPPTATLAEIDDLRERASRRGVSLFTTWHAQHNPAVQAAAALLAGKRVRDMAIVWHEDVDKWHPGQKWIWQAGGFGVFDPGINAFSIASMIFPGPLSVRRAALSFPHGSDTPIAADIDFASAASAGALSCSLDWRRTADEQWTIRVTTEDGMTVDLLEGGARLVVDGVERDVPGGGEYPDIYRSFAKLVDGGKSEVNAVPLRMVADCLLVGSRELIAVPATEHPPRT